MCYSNSSTSSTLQLSERYRKLKPSSPIELTYYFASGFHFPNWIIVTEDEKLQQMRWGLLPHWFKGNNWMDFASKTLNARQESCHEKASFKHLISNKRCLVPSTGFFEWQTYGKEKIPHFIRHAHQTIFSMAGLYDVRLNPSTVVQELTFTILTTHANDFMSEIHNTKKRMPLILEKEEEDLWLSQEVVLQDLADRADVELEAWTVNKKLLLSADANQEAVQQRYLGSFGIQKGLFD